MTFWSTLCRLAALSLLLSGAVDIVAIDLFGAFWQDKATVQDELNGSCAQDDCYCCSASAVPVQVVVLEPHFTIIFTDEVESVYPLRISPTRLFHPPRV
jgi:hypothetical protein